MAAKHQPKPLQVLLVEDSENDALLLEIELQRAGYAPTCERVETAEAMSAALNRRNWDVVIADYVMPRFNGLQALALVKERGLDLPFIIVSGHISDSTAVGAMKAGAHDYVMKDNLARLGSAVDRELREADERWQRRRADEKLKVEQVFRQAIENSVPAGIVAVDLEGRQTYVNPAFCAMLGWSEHKLVGARPPFVYWPPAEAEHISSSLAKVIEDNCPPGGFEFRFLHRSGELIDVLLQITALKDAFGNITGWVGSVSNITERKRAARRLAAEHAITRVLAGAQSLEEAAAPILQTLLDNLEVEFAGIWVLDPQLEVVRPWAMRLRTEAPERLAFLAARRQLSFRHGSGLPGGVWAQRTAAWVSDITTAPTFTHQGRALAAGLRSAAGFPLQSGNAFFGVLEFFGTRPTEYDEALINMMSAIGSEIGQFIKRRRAEEALLRAHNELEIRVQHRTAELKAANARLEASIAERRRLENELLEITEKERRRIGLDLHDDLGQKLSGIALMTKGLVLKLEKQRNEEYNTAERIHMLVQQAMSHARDLARDLATLDLPEKNLPAALEALAAHARDAFNISCRFQPQGAIPPLDPHVVVQLYKIAQEALTNAIKHGKAKRISISLANGNNRLLLTVQNNGVPFPDLHTHSTGMGLRIMNYRASLIGAALEIKAAGTGGGTRVSCSVPLSSN